MNEKIIHLLNVAKEKGYTIEEITLLIDSEGGDKIAKAKN